MYPEGQRSCLCCSKLGPLLPIYREKTQLEKLEWLQPTHLREVTQVLLSNASAGVRLRNRPVCVGVALTVGRQRAETSARCRCRATVVALFSIYHLILAVRGSLCRDMRWDRAHPGSQQWSWNDKADPATVPKTYQLADQNADRKGLLVLITAHEGEARWPRWLATGGGKNTFPESASQCVELLFSQKDLEFRTPQAGKTEGPSLKRSVLGAVEYERWFRQAQCRHALSFSKGISAGDINLISL